jgi:hypothetical protein
MKEVTPNLFRCQFLARGLEFLQFSETRQLGERVFYWAVLLMHNKTNFELSVT